MNKPKIYSVRIFNNKEKEDNFLEFVSKNCTAHPKGGPGWKLVIYGMSYTYYHIELAADELLLMKLSLEDISIMQIL